jgi:photosystem II stability/assembly factor-like uncharacterized protein
MIRRAALGGLVGALVLTMARAAGANGRYPQAGQLVVDPVNRDHWVARATFGILATNDAGRTWSWTCEDAVGYGNFEDPAIAVTANGSTVAAFSAGLSVSHDDGCSWNVPINLGFAIDVTVQPSDPRQALALTLASTDAGRVVALLGTSDDGATFNIVGSPIPGDFVGQTVEVAPSAPGRVYAGGNVQVKSAEGGPTSVLPGIERSDDGGQTWTRLLPELPGAFSVFIGAVDPSNPDVVYARVSGTSSGRLFLSRDGGATFTTILSAPGDLLGLALSRDGTMVAAGGPDAGIYLASTSDMVFRQVNTIGCYCLAWDEHRLLTCAKQGLAPFSVGASDDLGLTFHAAMRLSDIEPLACEAGTTGAVCSSQWPSIAALIQPDGGTISVSDGSNPVNGESPSSNCGCRLRPAKGRPFFSILALMGLVGYRRCKSKRRFRSRFKASASRLRR